MPRRPPSPAPSPQGGGGVAAAAAFAALLALVPAQAQDDPGAELYYRYGCYGCHGFDGKSRMMPLDVTTSGILGSEETFLSFLRMRADQNPMLPSTRMPNYPAESLSDDDARAIYAHILSIQSPDPEVADIPLFEELLHGVASE